MKACRMVQKAMALAAMGLAALTASAVNTFTAASGDWNTPGNWSEGIAPTNGESVVIDGNVSLTASTALLSSMTVNAGKTLTFDGWDTLLTATTVTIDGTVTHAQNTAAATNSLGAWVPNARVNIVCDTLDIPVGGKIDVAAKGFLGGMANTVAGKGPGGGTHRVGGGHGGKGGRPDLTSSTGITYGAGGLAYDSYATPEQPGSGGGGGDTTRAGGNGGGAVRIAADGAVTVNGSILAYGGPGIANHGAGGSGGSIFIACSTVSGAGVISAYGGLGANNTGGGGGGGCIAIAYNPTAQGALPLPGVEINAAGGNASYNSSRTGSVSQLGEPGTLAFPDNQLLTRVKAADVVKLSGQWTDMAFTEWRLDSLTLQNAWLSFPQSGFQLTVTNNLAIRGTDSKIHRLDTTNAVVTIGGNMGLSKASYVMYNDPEAGASLVVGGNLSLTNASSMYVYAPPLTESKPDYTALIDVAGAFTIAAGAGSGLTGGSWVYPHSDSYNGGSALFDVGSLRITTANAGFDANVKGYYGGLKNAVGYGPGAGNANVGGGHGGRGGFSATKGGGLVNDVADDPVIPGSGGGGGDGSVPPIDAGRGGGVVRIASAGPALVNGSILANGGNGFGNHGGGGAGGAISIACSSFHGTNGVLSAIGGNGNNVNGGGGGGGRISVRYSEALQAAVPVPSLFFSALGGTATILQYSGEPGTLHFPDTRLLADANGFLRSSGTPAIPGFTSWDLDRLVVSNSYLFLPDDFVLNVTNDLVLSGTSPTAHKLVARGGEINAGSLRLDKNAGLEIYADIVSDPSMPGAQVNVTGEMFIGPNAWVYPVSHPTNGGSVKFTVGSLDVNATGGFDATGRGFQGGAGWYSGSPAGYSDGYGPGHGGWVSGTPYQVFSKGSGAGHGGLGVQNTPVYGLTYGDYTAPVQPGSGGAGGDATSRPGGNGGGVIWIDATGTATVNGSLLADGTSPAEQGGAGAGGSVFLTCDKIEGSGTLSAKSLTFAGGDRRSGGAGGRISVIYNTASQNAAPMPDLRFTTSASASVEPTYAGVGSLYFPDNMFLTRGNVLKLSGAWMRDDFAGWDQADLTLDNAWLDMVSGGTPVALTGNLVVFGTNPNLSRLVLTNSHVTVSGNTLLDGGGLVLYPGETSIASMDVAGNLVVTNKGAIHVTGGITDSVFEYGAQVDVAGDMVVAANSWVYPYSHPTNGGSARFTVRNLDVLAGGGFDASKKGFAGAAAQTNGFGPGWGGFVRNKVSAMDGGGAGYGGRGGGWLEYAGNVFGETNGMFFAPAGPGSGGGGGLIVGYFGGAGGGAINIFASEDVVMNGSLLANGGNGGTGNSGGGSGGGIWVRSRKFSGTGGVISAAGGAGGGDMSGGGGGGRIAIWHDVLAEDVDRLLAGSMRRVATSSTLDTYTGTFTAVNGADKVKAGSFPPRSQPGTAVFLTVTPPAQTVIVVR